MINLQFFPSRRLASTWCKLFLTRSLAVLVALVLVLLTLDLLGESRQDPGGRRAMAKRRSGAMSSLRIPLLIIALPALLGAARHADHLRRSTRTAKSSR